MKKHADTSKGFIVAFFINLLFQSEWLIFSIILLILHYLFSLPILFFWLGIGVWTGISLLITLFFSWVASTPDLPSHGRQYASVRLRQRSKDKGTDSKDT